MGLFLILLTKSRGSSQKQLDYREQLGQSMTAAPHPGASEAKPRESRWRDWWQEVPLRTRAQVVRLHFKLQEAPLYFEPVVQNLALQRHALPSVSGNHPRQTRVRSMSQTAPAGS